MDDCSIAVRTDMLRREIEFIKEEERIYRGMPHHSHAHKKAHANRQLRLIEIRGELETLQKRES